MVWKSAKNEFQGGIEEAGNLFGKKIRLNHEITGTSVNAKCGLLIEFKAGMIDVVGYVPDEAMNTITVVSPDDRKIFQLV